MTTKRFALALTAPLAAAFVSAAGCTVTSVSPATDGASPAADGSTTTDGGATDAGALGFVPSNVPLDKIDFRDLDDIDVTKDDVIQASTAGLLTEGNLRYRYFELPQTNGPKLGVFLVKSLKVEAGVTLNASGGPSNTNAIVIIAAESIDLEGSITAFANRDTAYAGGFSNSGQPTNSAGVGPGGGGAGTTDSSPGGGGYCVAGGAGASISGGAAAAGGPAAGTPELVPLLGGGAGGTGAVGLGGAGGGAVQLVARNTITIGGTINVGGGGGTPGGHPSGQNASAGGSGGAILLEAATVTVTGGLYANGGGGGSADTFDYGMNGQASTMPTPAGGMGVAAGGAGSGATTPQGKPGTAGDMVATSSSGAGGGAAGRIRINTQTGSATLGGTFSPATTTPCVTQGTLGH